MKYGKKYSKITFNLYFFFQFFWDSSWTSQSTWCPWETAWIWKHWTAFAFSSPAREESPPTPEEEVPEGRALLWCVQNNRVSNTTEKLLSDIPVETVSFRLEP